MGERRRTGPAPGTELMVVSLLPPVVLPGVGRVGVELVVGARGIGWCLCGHVSGAYHGYR